MILDQDLNMLMIVFVQREEEIESGLYVPYLKIKIVCVGGGKKNSYFDFLDTSHQNL